MREIFTHTTKTASALVLGSVLGGAMFMQGCLGTKEPVANIPMPSLQCQNLADVSFTQGAANELAITQEQIAQAFYPKLDEICAKIDRSYTARISYESKLDEALKTTKLTAKETKTAIVSLKLDLSAKEQTHAFNGKSMLEVSGKKVLDIGESVEIESKDKTMLINQAAQAITNEMQKAFK